MTSVSEKKCTKCLNPKPLNRFRTRFKIRNGKKEFWVQGKCMDCESQEGSERYWSNPEVGRRTSRESARKCGKKRYEYNKRYRKRHARWWKAYMKKYREENKEKIAELHKITGRKWFKKERDSLSDNYIIRHIIQRTGLRKEDIQDQKELIELCRQNKLLRRKINDASCTK